MLMSSLKKTIRQIRDEKCLNLLLGQSCVEHNDPEHHPPNHGEGPTTSKHGEDSNQKKFWRWKIDELEKQMTSLSGGVKDVRSTYTNLQGRWRDGAIHPGGWEWIVKGLELKSRPGGRTLWNLKSIFGKFSLDQLQAVHLESTQRVWEWIKLSL